MLVLVTGTNCCWDQLLQGPTVAGLQADFLQPNIYHIIKAFNANYVTTANLEMPKKQTQNPVTVDSQCT